MTELNLPIHVSIEKESSKRTVDCNQAVDPKILAQFLTDTKDFLGLDQACNDRLFTSDSASTATNFGSPSQRCA